jgi:hypothetical protein
MCDEPERDIDRDVLGRDDDVLLARENGRKFETGPS